MATTKTLTPTNQTISIPELTDAPDMSVASNAIDKEADAINTLSEHLDPIAGTNKAWITNAELNNYKTTGVYYISTGSTIGGSSSGMSWFILTVIAGRSDTVVQTIYDSNTSASEKTRQYRSNAWSSWYSASEQIGTLNSNLNTKTKYETESNTPTNGQLIDTTGANYTNIQRFGRVVVINFQCKIKSTATDSGNELYYFSNLTKWQPQNISRGWICENGKSTATGIMGYCGIDTWTEDGQTVLGIYLAKASAFAGKNILGQITYMLKNEPT